MRSEVEGNLFKVKFIMPRIRHYKLTTIWHEYLRMLTRRQSENREPPGTEKFWDIKL